MSTVRIKDRVSVCLFTFSDGRRCRTPRSGTHPHFCFYHARKESQARAAENLGEDLSYFFSADFVTACDLSTALARLLPAVARGDIKPKTATTLAYMAQTFLQTLHLSQKEFIDAVGEREWRKTVCNSLNQNFKYLNSQSDDPADAEDPPNAPQPNPKPASPQPPAHPRPPYSPPQHSATTPTPQPKPISDSASASALDSASAPDSAPASAPSLSPAPQVCHPERSEGSRCNPAPSTDDENPADSSLALSAKPATNPGAEPTQPDSKVPESARANSALAVARSRFRRRSTNTPTNPFKTNIYERPRNC